MNDKLNLENELFDVIFSGEISIEDKKAKIEELINAGVDLNCTEVYYGFTPLYKAFNTFNGFDKELAEFLISRGADVNALDERGNTLLHSCVGDSEVVKFLLCHNAKIQINADGKTPMDLAQKGKEKNNDFIETHRVPDGEYKDRMVNNYSNYSNSLNYLEYVKLHGNESFVLKLEAEELKREDEKLKMEIDRLSKKSYEREEEIE